VIERVLPYETDYDTYKYCNCYPYCDCYHCTCERTDITHTRVASPERHLKPLDIIEVSEGEYKHVGVYLGRIDGEYKVCNYSKKYEGTRIHTLDHFLRDYNKGNGKITCYHPMIPFKHYSKIAKQIAWAYDVDFRAKNYSLSNRNCEHFANMIVYGINYSQQIEDNKGIVNTGKVVSSFLGGATLGLSFLATGVPEGATNNDKGSTIKLINEMRETEDKLG
jgi:hypothetical protein